MENQTKNISAKILFLLASYYDSRPGHPSLAETNELINATKNYADVVAAALEGANPQTQKQWERLVFDALRVGQLNVGETALPVAELRGFAEAVATATGVNVAPRESDWFRGLEAALVAKISTINPPIPKKMRDDSLQAWRKGEPLLTCMFGM